MKTNVAGLGLADLSFGGGEIVVGCQTENQDPQSLAAPWGGGPVVPVNLEPLDPSCLPLKKWRTPPHTSFFGHPLVCQDTVPDTWLCLCVCVCVCLCVSVCFSPCCTLLALRAVFALACLRFPITLLTCFDFFCLCLH